MSELAVSKPNAKEAIDKLRKKANSTDIFPGMSVPEVLDFIIQNNITGKKEALANYILEIGGIQRHELTDDSRAYIIKHEKDLKKIWGENLICPEPEFMAMKRRGAKVENGVHRK